mmetsp:Transcript_15706/g.29964  ORF Transcript_15706/g.29964 Transcript_15706/m.29964 type:complete len:403 (-) Transcript_15706:70-1278(-)
MTTTTTLLHANYQHPSTLYPVVEDLTELEYGCCPCDENNTMLGRFPLRDIAFPLSQALDTHNQKPEEVKSHRRTLSSSSHKRRSSRDSSFDDEITVNTDNEESAGKFDDSFVLTRQIFSCTQSQVWECVHRASGLRRCVKIIDFDTLTPEEYEAARREVLLLRKVNGNDGIIGLREVYVNRKTYVVMDLATGGNLLSRVIQQEALPEETVRNIATTVLRAIQHMQALNICHNDIQPSNLVLNGMDRVALIDFGRACATGERLDHGALHTSYTSPEIVNFNSSSPVSDVWSLGAIVYFCFFGQAPVPYSKRRAELTFPYNENVSRQAKQFMIACLHHDPTVRLTAEEALAHPWLGQVMKQKETFSWKQFWKKWFCGKEPNNDINTPSTSGSSGAGFTSFSWRQ